VPQSKRVSVTSGAACADADRLIKALAQAPIASKDRVRFMVSSQEWQQIRIWFVPGMLPSRASPVNPGERPSHETAPTMTAALG